MNVVFLILGYNNLTLLYVKHHRELLSCIPSEEVREIKSYQKEKKTKVRRRGRGEGRGESGERRAESERRVENGGRRWNEEEAYRQKRHLQWISSSSRSQAGTCTAELT